MIRSSAVLIAAAIGVLVAGVIASNLQLVYVSIGVSALAGVLLAVGVLLRRGEIFGGSGVALPGGEPAWPPGHTADMPVMATGTALNGLPGDRAPGSPGWPAGSARPAAVGPDVSSRPGGRAPGRTGAAKTGPARGGRPGGYSGAHGADRGRPPSSPGKRGQAGPSWPGEPTRPDKQPRADSPGRPEGDWRAGLPERPDTPPPGRPRDGRAARRGPAPAGKERPRPPGADRPPDGAFHRGPPGSGLSGHDDFWDRVSGELADGGGHDTGAPAWEATAGPRAMGGQRPGPAETRAPRPDADDAAARFSATGPPEQAEHPATATPEPAPPGRGKDDAEGAGPQPRWGLVVPKFTEEPGAAGERPPGPPERGRAKAGGRPPGTGPRESWAGTESRQAEAEFGAETGTVPENAPAGVVPRGERTAEAREATREADAKAAGVREGTGAGAGVAGPAAGKVPADSGADRASAGAAAETKAGAAAGAKAGGDATAGRGATAEAKAGADAGDGGGDGRQREPGEDRPQRPDRAGAGGQPAADGSLDEEVTIVQGIGRYHRRDCILIRFLGDDDLESMTRREAVAANCMPCKACQPDKPLADG